MGPTLRRSALALVLMGCGEGHSPGTSDGAPSDAGGDGSVDAPHPCDVGTPPADLPALVGHFLIADASGPDSGTDAGSSEYVVDIADVPTATGGDPTGLWVFETLTYYSVDYDDDNLGLFRPESTELGGTAWAEFSGSEYRLALDLSITLPTHYLGTIHQDRTDYSRGTYAVTGTTIAGDPIATCREGDDAELVEALEFSVSGTTLSLIVRDDTGVGEVILVLEGTRR